MSLISKTGLSTRSLTSLLRFVVSQLNCVCFPSAPSGASRSLACCLHFFCLHYIVFKVLFAVPRDSFCIISSVFFSVNTFFEFFFAIFCLIYRTFYLKLFCILFSFIHVDRIVLSVHKMSMQIDFDKIDKFIVIL